MYRAKTRLPPKLQYKTVCLARAEDAAAIHGKGNKEFFVSNGGKIPLSKLKFAFGLKALRNKGC